MPRVLVDISRRSMATTLFGRNYDAPFGIAPLGLSALSAYRGDIVLAQAAAGANVPMIMSGSSLIRLEEVASASREAWFQAYLPGDTRPHRGTDRARRQAGYATLVITVDTAVSANRENNVRAGFSTPLRPSLRLAWDGVIPSALAVRHLPEDPGRGTACRISRTATPRAGPPSCRRTWSATFRIGAT